MGNSNLQGLKDQTGRRTIEPIATANVDLPTRNSQPGNPRFLSEGRNVDFENLKVGERIQLEVSNAVQCLTPEQIKPTAGPVEGWRMEVARVFVDGGTVRFRDDPGGEPTETDGDVLNDGDYWHLVGEGVECFRVISQSGTVKINISPFYKFGS